MSEAVILDENIPVIAPSIYEKFSCKCGSCRNTCCQGWTISISRAEYNKVRNICDHSKDLPDASQIFSRLPRKEATDDFYAKVKLTEPDHYCPLFSVGGLCSLQLKAGYSVLPYICKKYPRLLTILDEKEAIRMLDLSCERTLELLLEISDKPLQFQTTFGVPVADKLASISSDIFTEYASDIRNLCIWILQNRAYPLSERLLLLGMAMRELNKIQQAKQPERVPDWFARHLSFAKDASMGDLLHKIKGDSELFVHNNIRFYTLQSLSTPRLNPMFQCMLKNIGYYVHDKVQYFKLEDYQATCATFNERFPNIENFFESCLVMCILLWTFPFGKASSVWKAYTRLCSLYSLIRFTAVTSLPENTESLIDNLVLLFRTSTSNINFDKLSCNILELSQSDTLAHIAILLRG